MNLFNILSKFEGYPVEISFFPYDRREHAPKEPIHLSRIYTVEFVLPHEYMNLRERFLITKELSKDEEASDHFLNEKADQFLWLIKKALHEHRR